MQLHNFLQEPFSIHTTFIILEIGQEGDGLEHFLFVVVYGIERRFIGQELFHHVLQPLQKTTPCQQKLNPTENDS